MSRTPHILEGRIAAFDSGSSDRAPTTGAGVDADALELRGNDNAHHWRQRLVGRWRAVGKLTPHNLPPPTSDDALAPPPTSRLDSKATRDVAGDRTWPAWPGPAEVHLTLTPVPGLGLEFVALQNLRRDHPDFLPASAIGPIEQGALHACWLGGCGGLPLVGLRVELNRGRIDRNATDARALFLAAYCATRATLLAAHEQSLRCVDAHRTASRCGMTSHVAPGLAFESGGTEAEAMDDTTPALTNELRGFGPPLDHPQRWAHPRRERIVIERTTEGAADVPITTARAALVGQSGAHRAVATARLQSAEPPLEPQLGGPFPSLPA